MPEIYVDTDELRWQAGNLRVFLDSIRRTGKDIHAATFMADGYEGQLRRKVMGIAGDDESLVRRLADELEEMIQRLTQLVDAFEAADSIRGSNPILGGQMMQLIDGGMLLSSFPWEYLQASPQERRLWALETGQHDLALLGIDNQQLQAFAQSPLLPVGGSEADFWNAFLVFLYVNGAIQTQPQLETWRSAASTSGRDLAAYVASTQRFVTGTVRVRLHKGNCTVVGRRSPKALYDLSLATYDRGDRFDPKAAPGFIEIWGLPVRTQARVQELWGDTGGP